LGSSRRISKAKLNHSTLNTSSNSPLARALYWLFTHRALPDQIPWTVLLCLSISSVLENVLPHFSHLSSPGTILSGISLRSRSGFRVLIFFPYAGLFSVIRFPI
jgi:hypothetical protein